MDLGLEWVESGAGGDRGIAENRGRRDRATPCDPCAIKNIEIPGKKTRCEPQIIVGVIVSQFFNVDSDRMFFG